MPARKLLRWMGPVVLAVFARASALPEVQAVESRRALSPVSIDGQADEWRLSGLTPDKKSGAELAFQNDGGNLYVLVVLKNPDSRKAFDATGITILSSPGKAQKPGKGVLFLSRSVSADGYIAWQESRGAVLTDAARGLHGLRRKREGEHVRAPPASIGQRPAGFRRLGIGGPGDL
jgi:hypothetical protein